MKIIILALLLPITTLFALNLSDVPIETKAGKLTVVKDSFNENFPAKILLNGKSIKKFRERPYVYFEKNFKGKNSDIVLISCNYGGSHTPNDFMVIELFKNERYKVSPIVASCHGDYKVVKSVEGLLKIDLGNCGGQT